jgi:hypothetical protein
MTSILDELPPSPTFDIPDPNDFAFSDAASSNTNDYSTFHSAGDTDAASKETPAAGKGRRIITLGAAMLAVTMMVGAFAVAQEIARPGTFRRRRAALASAATAACEATSACRSSFLSALLNDPSPPVEPYLGSYCATILSLDSAVPSRDVDSADEDIRSDHIPIEPELGNWCYSQFPASMPAGRADTVKKLRASHVRIEKWLKRWADEAAKTENAARSVSLEPFAAGWCSEQFGLGLSSGEIAAVAARHQRVEPFVANWCSAQYGVALPTNTTIVDGSYCEPAFCAWARDASAAADPPAASCADYASAD